MEKYVYAGFMMGFLSWLWAIIAIGTQTSTGNIVGLSMAATGLFCFTAASIIAIYDILFES